MAVLVEGISVLIRKDSIQNKMTGGDARFKLLISNSTFCEDDQLARVGFLNPNDVESFIDDLKNVGLTFMEDSKAIDIAICDQQRGLTTECDWIEFCRLSMGDGRVGVAWLFEGERRGAGIHIPSRGMNMATPPGWKFKDSLSEKFQFVPNNETYH